MFREICTELRYMTPRRCHIEINFILNVGSRSCHIEKSSGPCSKLNVADPRSKIPPLWEIPGQWISECYIETGRPGSLRGLWDFG